MEPRAAKNHAFRLHEWTVRPVLNRMEGPAGAHQVEPRVMDALVYLVDRPGEVIGRDEILDAVWGDTVVCEHVLTRAIAELRRMLGDDSRTPRFIETIRKGGYRLIAPVDWDVASPAPKSAPVSPRPMRLLWWLANAVVLTLAAVLFHYLPLRAHQPEPGLLLALPFTSYPGLEQNPAISPNGTQVAFSWGGPTGENVDIYLKQRNTETPLRLTDHDGYESHPAWSPDGAQIAFCRATREESAIFVIPAIGGTARKLADTQAFVGGLDWSPDGDYLAFSQPTSWGGRHQIHLLAVRTGEVRVLTDPPTEKEHDQLPRFSPDGKQIAFLRGATFDSRDIYRVPTAGGDAVRVTPALLGVHGLDWLPGTDELILAATTGGSMRSELWRLSVSDRHMVRLRTAADWCASPTVASQGCGLVYEIATCETKINVIDRATEEEVTLIASTRWDGQPQFSPDGNRIAFVSSRSGANELWVCEHDGSRPVQVTQLNATWIHQPYWSPDGRRLIFSANLAGQAQIHVVELLSRNLTRLTDGAQNDHVQAWSRDGAHVYFASDRGGAWQIWRMPPEGGSAEQITRNGGVEVAVCADGERFVIRRPSGHELTRIRFGEAEPETVLLTKLPGSFAGNWTLWGEYVYWLQPTSEGGRIGCYDLQADSAYVVARSPLHLGPGLTISPDGRRLLFGCADRIERDLMLVEDFR